MCFAARAREPGWIARPVNRWSPRAWRSWWRHVDRRPAGEFILTFENGEVWQQADLRTKVDIKRGDQVVIRRSTSGAFTLVSRDGQSTRVKRVH